MKPEAAAAAMEDPQPETRSELDLKLISNEGSVKLILPNRESVR